MPYLAGKFPDKEQKYPTPYSPPCVKDLIEESLFIRNRDLFAGFEMVFFDTISIYFVREGGETLGENEKSKYHRRGLKQMMLGAVIDDNPRAVCC